jgi:hypothetical protein
MAYGKKLAKYFRKWMNHATWQMKSTTIIDY